MYIEDTKKPQMFGVSRSGGTFIYNIIHEIFDGNIQPQYVKEILARLTYLIFLGCLVIKYVTRKLSNIGRFFVPFK